jgi:predicted AAA+ superfamily ATPase
MRICCQDLFFARARSTDAAHTLVNGATTNGKSPLEKAFQHVTSMPQRTNVVSELVNIKVTSINDVDYSPKVLYIELTTKFIPIHPFDNYVI